MTSPTDGRNARRDCPLVVVDDLQHPLLDAADHHHLAKALRVPAGAPVTVSDGQGRWRTIVFDPESNGRVSETAGEVMEEAAPEWELCVGFAPVKGERPEWTVQKLTELGVDRIVPIQTERSVVRWDEGRWQKQAVKWRRIAREASMQSRRVRLPIIDDLVSFDDLMTNHPAAVLADPDGSALSRDDRFVVIGPEGGWAPRERAGRPLVSLPGGVLRAETAALTAAAIMALHRQARPSNQK